jgi:hypothetical protein
MSNSESINANDNREIPDDLSIPDFLRRDIAEASRVIAEIDHAETELSEPEPA